MKLFGKSVSYLSKFINVGFSHKYNNFKELFVWNIKRLTFRKYEEFSRIISLKQEKVPNCIGFIDGTVRPICRPTKNQRIFYSGHKWIHCLKFQNVFTPD